MAEISFSIADLFEKTFKYKSQAFEPAFKPVIGDGGADSISRTKFGASGSEYYINDALGREYFMPVKIAYPDGSGTTETSNFNGVTGGTPDQTTGGGIGVLKEWYLPYPVISISSRKTIVETPLTERRGTVKELINIQDYEILIKGFIINANNEFPETDVTTLRNIYEQNIAVSIQCPLTDIFLLRPDRSGSDQVVIRELRFPSITGIKNIRPYELHMVCDEPFNLFSITG